MTYEGPGFTVWRQRPGAKLHAIRHEGGFLTVSCCDRSWITSGAGGEEMDYRYIEYGNTCRKKGCAAYFEASREGRLG